MKTVLGMQQTEICSIPMDIGTGYNRTYSGKIYYGDGRFGIYTTIQVLGSDGESLNSQFELDACYDMFFSEMPCDEKGVILLDHYEITPYQSTTFPHVGTHFVQLMLICSREPTYRVNLFSGELTNNLDDHKYIRGMEMSYVIAQC
ncbi:hypothetical protein QF86_001282 [Salmonella enterica subsp. salamae]|nr:hypothetical protein [Salmonella enterica subsp. salamae]